MFVFLSLFVSSNTKADVVTVNLSSFSGTFTSVPFVFEGTPTQTGLITVVLDPTGVNVLGFDTDSGIGFVDVSLRVHFPLLDAIGEEALRIHILESGPATVDQIGFTATMFGGGTIEGPSAFEGVSFLNRNRYFCFGCEITFSPVRAVNGFGTFVVTDGIVLFPDRLGGGQASIAGQGDLTCNVPEPTTILLLGTGVTGVAIKMRKRLKSDKSAQRRQ